MLSRDVVRKARVRAAKMLAKAKIVTTAKERAKMEVADFGLGELLTSGLEIVVYENNRRYCAKELIMFPRQTCPEHRHPAVSGDPGKMETFRCRWGKAFLYVPGARTKRIKARVPKGAAKYYTVFHEVILNPGEQYTIPSNTLHWFQAGPAGAVVSEFSSTSRDEADVFTDPRIKRVE